LRWALPAWILIGLVGLAAWGTGNRVKSPETLFAEVSPTVVRIETFDRNGDPLATGTGFVLSSDGRIATNFHVISRS
jgi:S1-C subfamily serine protease